MTLQAQLASLKEQAAHCIMNSSSSTIAAPNPNHEKFYGGGGGGDVQSWWQSSQFDANFHSNVENAAYFAGATTMNVNNKENSSFGEENRSFGSFDSGEMQSSNERQWPFQDDADDLQSVAFRYIHHS